MWWNEHPFPFASLERMHTEWGNFLGVVWIKVSGFILFPSLFLWQYHLYPQCTSKAFLLFKGYNKSWAKIDYLITKFLVESSLKYQSYQPSAFPGRGTPELSRPGKAECGRRLAFQGSRDPMWLLQCKLVLLDFCFRVFDLLIDVQFWMAFGLINYHLVEIKRE